MVPRRTFIFFVFLSSNKKRKENTTRILFASCVDISKETSMPIQNLPVNSQKKPLTKQTALLFSFQTTIFEHIQTAADGTFIYVCGCRLSHHG
jgi:hypothetical protein